MLPRALRWILTAMLAIAPSIAWADRPDFSGHWVLDADASDPMDPVFQLQGAPWAMRKIAAGFDDEADIQQHADRLEVIFENLTGTHLQRLHFDSTPHATVNPAGMAMSFTTRWEDEERVLVASGQMTGKHVGTRLEERRSLSADGARMTVLITFTRPDGASASARRIYARTPAR